MRGGGWGVGGKKELETAWWYMTSIVLPAVCVVSSMSALVILPRVLTPFADAVVIQCVCKHITFTSIIVID